MSIIDWWWLIPAAILDLSVYACAGWEWHLLLQPVGRLSTRQAIQAVFAGRFANDVLPVHAGYVIRIYLAAHWMGKSISSIIPSLLVERLFDGLWLATGIGLLILLFPLPSDLTQAGTALGLIILAGTVILCWIIVRRPREGRVVPGALYRWKAAATICSFIKELDEGLRTIGRSYLALVALGISLLKLALEALAFLAVLNAYDFGFSFWIKMTVFLVTYIGISVPSTPAGLGVFQLFCTAGLMHFGIAKPLASGFALVAYVVLTAPLAIAGWVAITQSGLTLRQARNEIRQWNPRGKG